METTTSDLVTISRMSWVLWYIFTQHRMSKFAKDHCALYDALGFGACFFFLEKSHKNKMCFLALSSHIQYALG